MNLDGGFAYIAGHCGLVPGLGENYCEWRVAPPCISPWATGTERQRSHVFFDKVTMTIFAVEGFLR